MFLMLLWSCASQIPVAPSVPVAPETPEVQVLRYQGLLSASNNSAVRTAAALRDAGKLDAKVVSQVEDLSLQVAITDKKIAVIMGDGTGWQIQKVQVASLLAQLGISKLTSDPTIQSAFSQVLDLLHKIEVLVAP